MRLKSLYIGLLVVVMSLSSCRTKNFLYLTNIDPGVEYAYLHPETKVHAGDKLRITVSSKNPELAVPFNANGGAFLSISKDGSVQNTAETRSAHYRVDDNGCIEFPLLGRVHVEGLTADEVETLIKNKIIAGKYINNPLVTMEFQNFRYTTLGAISSGVHYAEDGHITLIEAIANAGGIPAGGNFKRVLVYREENGKLKMYPHDLTDKAVLESPCYQLQQNDIIYVEPKYKKTTIVENSNRMLTALMSISTVLTTCLTIYGVFKK